MQGQIIGYRKNGCPIRLIRGGSQPAVEPPPAPAPPSPTPPAPAWAPPASQEELNRIIGDRVARERAKYEGFDDLKSKAEKFDQLEEQNKTDIQKATERADAAEQRAALAEAQVTRATVAAAKGVPVGLLSGNTKEELEASADALLAFRGTGAAPAPVPGLTPGQGTAQVKSVAAGAEMFANRKNRKP